MESILMCCNVLRWDSRGQHVVKTFSFEAFALQEINSGFSHRNRPTGTQASFLSGVDRNQIDI